MIEIKQSFPNNSLNKKKLKILLILDKLTVL